MQDLNLFIDENNQQGRISFARGINNKGQIAVEAFILEDELVVRQFAGVLNPVPEPTTMFLFSSGLIGVCLRKRRT